LQLKSQRRKPRSINGRVKATTTSAHYRSKTVAAWLALVLGTLGVHRMYLYGLRDRWAWVHPLPSAAGLLGVMRVRALGQDDALAWILIPLLGLMISWTMLCATLYALTPDDKWDARHNPGSAVTGTAWGPVLAAILALLLGGTALMGTVAYSGQKFFEWRAEQEAPQNKSRLNP
jgi:predicted ferric reductase